MQITINKTGAKVYLVSLAIMVLVSTFQTQLAMVEDFRLNWVRSLEPERTDWVGWAYSVAQFGMMGSALFLCYALWLKVKYQQDFNAVVTDDYEMATYKILPLEKYEELSRHIPKTVKDAVLARDGMKCRITGKPVYFEPQNKLAKLLWEKTKDSRMVGIRMLSLFFDRHMLDYGHIIPLRLGGRTTVDNIIVESHRHNRASKSKLYGKKKKLALIKLKEWGETIHRGAL